HHRRMHYVALSAYGQCGAYLQMQWEEEPRDIANCLAEQLGLAKVQDYALGPAQHAPIKRTGEITAPRGWAKKSNETLDDYPHVRGRTLHKRLAQRPGQFVRWEAP